MLHVKDDAGVAVKVRLHGIDAPERKQPYGAEAVSFLTLIALNEPVDIMETDIDRYGNTVAIVILDNSGVVLQEALLRAGYAWFYEQDCKSCEYWRSLEQDAKENKRGLWAGEAMEPWEWRNRELQGPRVRGKLAE